MLSPTTMRLCVLWSLLALLGACTGAPAPTTGQPGDAVPVASAAEITAATAVAVPGLATAAPTAAPAAAPTAAPLSAERALGRGRAPQRLIAVMIDNHPKAYPQIGLNGAVVVFEALAEFGITRYMAIFAPGISPELAEIGPVRSARAYFVEWAKGLDAVYAHAGGSPEGLLLAETAQEILNLDALHQSGGAYFRRSSQRAAPHNLFTSSAALARAVADRKAAAFDPADHGFIFKEDAPAARRPASQRLSYFFIYKEATVGWVYDPQTNGYLYLRNGKAHVDARSGQQVWFKNVIVMEVPERPIPGDPKGRIEQQVIGEGPARLFVDGMKFDITWRKPAGFAPLRFYDAADNEVALNAGPVWIAAVPTLKNLKVEGGT